MAKRGVGIGKGGNPAKLMTTSSNMGKAVLKGRPSVLKPSSSSGKK